MKRLLAIVLAAVLLTAMMFTLASCGKKEKLIVGVTPFEPMNFQDANGKWTGFDSEFALAVGKKLGMDIEFQEITWGQKFVELQSGAIDAIWNGMTANTIDGTTGRPRHEDTDFSYSYMLNKQCVVIRTDMAGQIKSLGDLAGKTMAAEKSSAGEAIALEVLGSDVSIIDVVAQIDTFIEIKSGAVAFAIVDSILAYEMTGSGDYSDLMVADIELGGEPEVYAIGFRIGSDLVEKVNTAIMALYNDGTLTKIAEKYGLEKSLAIGTDPIK